MIQKVTKEQWEQRRYEIAKEVLPMFRGSGWKLSDEEFADCAIHLEDALIAKLKNEGDKL